MGTFIYCNCISCHNTFVFTFCKGKIKLIMKQISFPKSFSYPERSPLHFSSFGNFKKSRDAACCVKITHPSSISLSFVFILYQHVMVRLPSDFPVTQTTPLSKESKESLVYIHVCVFEILGKSGFGEQVGGQAHPALKFIVLPLYTRHTRRCGSR